jgi:DNA processing protein
MGWENDAYLKKAQQEGIERMMFPELSPEEQRVVDVLAKHNDLHLNMLAMQADMAVNQLTGVLFELELKGMVKTLAGGVYHLLA